MIGTIEIRVNSANPQMPLKTLATFQGSPSTIRLLEVPKAIGEWNITDVKILVKYPDNTQVAKSCVRVGNIWQGTISAPEMSGKVTNGFEVIADGEDEDGNPVENYILGVGDVEVLSRDSQALKDVEKVYVKFSDELPLTASKGDFVYHNGQYYIFNGTTWDAISTGGEIPTKVSQLENDVGYITENDVPEQSYIINDLSTSMVNALGEHWYRPWLTDEQRWGEWTKYDDWTTYDQVEWLVKDEDRKLSASLHGQIAAVDSKIPTNVSQLSNDRNYTTRNVVQGMLPTKMSQLSNDAKYVQIVPEGARDSGLKQTIYTSWLSNDAGYITENDVPEIPTKVSELENDVPYATTENLDQVEEVAQNAQSRVGVVEGRVDALQGAVDSINEVIPDQATSDNQLADKAFVNSSINNVAAYYITKNADGDAFSTKAELDATETFYCGGEIRVPTQNDYCLVQADETKSTEQGNPTTRYSFQNGSWSFQYVVNNTPLTSQQLYILNNGATKDEIAVLRIW